MKLIMEDIEIYGKMCADAVIRYGDISLDVSLVGNELQLPEFVTIPLELREEIHHKILAAMCRERRKAA